MLKSDATSCRAYEGFGAEDLDAKDKLRRCKRNAPEGGWSRSASLLNVDVVIDDFGVSASALRNEAVDVSAVKILVEADASNFGVG